MKQEEIMDQADLANDQLRRMRGMTGCYHQRFFSDMRAVSVGVLALFVLGWSVAPEAFLLIPVVAVLGANQAAFDSSYLIFARHYAAELESFLNQSVGGRILVAAEMEDGYLFPLNTTKIVTIPLGPPTGSATGFSWFAWMTALYTLLGVLVAGAGLALGWSTLTAAGAWWIVFYIGSLGGLVAASLAIGWWWFLKGAGERRLRAVFETPLGSVENDPAA
jgi:hypothetical protein